MEENRNIFVFDSAIPGMRFIHPLKQDNMYKVLLHLPATVEELWVFGSAVTYNHFPWSDLDLFVTGNLELEDRKTIVLSAGCSVDLIVDSRINFGKYSTVFGHCYYRILKEGIKYYDRTWFK